jgi:3'-5' exoribonuclease
MIEDKEKNRMGTRQRVWIRDIKHDDIVQEYYLVKEKILNRTKRGDPFLSLTLADRTGEIEARLWDRVDEFTSLFSEGDIVEIKGQATSYKDQLQLTISHIKKAGEVKDYTIFLECSRQDPSEMMKELKKLLLKVDEPNLRKLINLFLADHDFLKDFKIVPAAKNFHHAYLGGLLEHTLSVCKIATAIVVNYPDLNRNLMLTGAFIHDIGKVPELSYQYKINYTDKGRLMGHIILGIEMLNEKLSILSGFPEELAIKLKHIILTHHGEYEFGSPKRPKIPEALAIHLIDDLDAKLSGLIQFMERDAQLGSWTDFHRIFQRYFLKGPVRLEVPSCGDDRYSDSFQVDLFSSRDRDS